MWFELICASCKRQLTLVLQPHQDELDSIFEEADCTESADVFFNNWLI
jgi:hypothetical protein